ncbi:hypothetical protein [Absiella sp. AM54-8XD]|uniref:hypothetical protein n=1 Tax=Absiella sp. AM54-8XD TaxID=2292279 RepID=UPI0013143B59|nr:hypothetical protein [Absiella sp. AM54-8XD]
MKKKLSDHLFTMVAVAIILFAGITYLKPEVQEKKAWLCFSGYLGRNKEQFNTTS